ncbi:L-threonylcarbamoyladenylate synthase [Halanaerobium hydrogeniformans]|uniref:Threonylcarbamoyl-AMP synthase n=1 Tax=Halanaerobium hydrogeniformans TaxID=656519 RepID=E4RP41_HALHG|nr:L-threonylcarbamoyladenylate synthase [Halanaerobium hydrogeniformans]ADQ13866.1 Sua5/YciO/YrdC/YwlC family protein [Halanaerobium hydrogeniformans]
MNYQTEIIKANNDDQAVEKAAELLHKGELVAIPTETVYGLAADALNPEAVKRIFEAKGRPQDNPLIIHIGAQKDLEKLIAEKVSKRAQKLIDKYWPGPLTLIFKKSSLVPAETSAGLDTVAVRMPSHPVTIKLLQKSGLVLAAPSANTSGYPSPTRAEHVYADLKTKIPLILDGGSCEVGVESTVIDLSQKEAVVLRPGGISREELAEFLGEELKLNNNLEKSTQGVISPGMKYRHYAPQKNLYIFDPVKKDLLFKKAEQKKIALIISRQTELGQKEDQLKVIRAFDREKPAELARKLFALLRELDSDPEVEEIYIEELKEEGLGETLMNRIYKAAAAKDEAQPGGGDNS